MGDDLFDFLIEGGDELLNKEECPHCGEIVHLDTDITCIDKEQAFCKCPHCGEKIKIK